MSEAELAAVDRVRGDVPISTWLKALAADAVAASGVLAVEPAKLERAQEVSKAVVRELSPREQWLMTLRPGR